MMNSSRLNSLVIQTPEGIQFGFLLASPISRFFAAVIDLACISAAYSLLRVISLLLSLALLDMSRAVDVLAAFILPIFYGITCEWYFRGQTFGKRILRLRVMDAEGLHLRRNQVILRNLLRAVDMLPGLYLVGGMVTWFSPISQRLGDIAANTVVIRLTSTEVPEWQQLLAGKFNSLRQHPHLEARLRQRVSPVETSIALRAILRRDEFNPVPRAELFARIAGHFRALVEFPPEAVETLSDEQYIRNVLDAILRPRAKK